MLSIRVATEETPQEVAIAYDFQPVENKTGKG
jgi:hypothetical protein